MPIIYLFAIYGLYRILRDIYLYYFVYRKYSKGKHHCNKCEISFIDSYELQYTKCPLCDNELEEYKGKRVK